jgi:UDP-GlcNAc3NAcA epimerase
MQLGQANYQRRGLFIGLCGHSDSNGVVNSPLFADNILTKLSRMFQQMPDSTKILTVIGARPQFIKASVVSHALQKTPGLDEIIVHTGQHFAANMSDVFFEELEIPEPNYHLGISSLSHGAMTGRMLEAIENVIQTENPEFVLVYGDTNSTLAGALAAKKLHKRVIHVEAGLRSFDMRMPEEINRILTDRISDLLFCPTETAVKNLHAEGFQNFPCQFFNSGDVMFDAVLFFRQRAYLSAETEKQLPQSLADFVLCTIHRAENTDNPARLKNIFAALEEIHRQIPVVLLIHPRTKKQLAEQNIEPKVLLIEPVGYLEMLRLLERCRMVLTDSGGLQKEAFFLQKPCLTLRDTTEWTELIEHGVNFLVGSEHEKIVLTFHKTLTGTFDFNAGFYGDGKAGEKIISAILQSL